MEVLRKRPSTALRFLHGPNGGCFRILLRHDTKRHRRVSGHGLVKTKIKYQRCGELSEDEQRRFTMHLVVDPERKDLASSSLLMQFEDTIPTNVRKKS